MTNQPKTKLAYLVTHPIQYQAPLLREIAARPDIELTALYMSDFSLKAYQDPGFGTSVAWDIPLTEGYNHEFLPFLGKDTPLSGSRPFSIGILKALKRGKYDAIWMHGYAHLTSLRFILACRLMGIKILTRSDSQLASAWGGGMARKIKGAVVRQVFKKIDAFLAAGSNNADYYAYYGAPREKIFMMPYAVDNDFFQKKASEAKPNREAFRASLGLEPGRPVILFASKLIGRKNADHLLEAYKRLSPDGKSEPNAYLLYVGSGEMQDALQAQADATGWSSIKFLGFKNQTELPAFFDLCDVFVLPSITEPWGLIVNEVMNAAKPMVVSQEVGCAPDLVKNGVNGFTFPAGNIDELAKAIATIVNDPKLAAEMGEKSLEIINHWGFKENIDVLIEALEYVKKA